VAGIATHLGIPDLLHGEVVSAILALIWLANATFVEACPCLGIPESFSTRPLTRGFSLSLIVASIAYLSIPTLIETLQNLMAKTTRSRRWWRQDGEV
jgi:hypothetical protein